MSDRVMAKPEIAPVATLDKSGRTPEEAALVMRLRVFNNVRWGSLAMVLGSALVATFVFGITFPLAPVYIICAFIAMYNTLLVRQIRNLENKKPELLVHRARSYGYIHITLDMITAAVLLHFTGGIENPFIFLFVIHIMTASIVLHYRTVYLLATMAIALTVAVVGLEYAGILPHVNLGGFAEPTLYRQESYILAVLVCLALILYLTTFSATAISGELRKRQREVVQLRESLIEQKTSQLAAASNEIAKLEEGKKRFLRFIGIAAHDLKAPLTAIQGFLWLMLGGYTGELNEKQKNLLDRSAKRITELLGLISDLLDIPRIETGQIVQEVKEVSLADIFKAPLEELTKQAEEKGLKVSIDIAEALPAIRGSPPRLQQVINNLFHNSINYTHEGGITVRVKDHEDCVLCEVQDTGIGIPQPELPHLFEDFYRASNVDRKGTGLGLSIAKRIIEAHGGRIWAESPPAGEQVGSRFSFTLPKLTAGGMPNESGH